MQADWVWGFAGGLVIGLAGAVFLLVNGRVMGASGLIGGLVDGSGRGNRAERLAFLAALVAVPAGLARAGVAHEVHLTGNAAVLVLAGLLVGLGTRLANGCTSGHGVCGISRLSPRGLAASALYIAAGGVTVLNLRHLMGLI